MKLLKIVTVICSLFFLLTYEVLAITVNVNNEDTNVKNKDDSKIKNIAYKEDNIQKNFDIKDKVKIGVFVNSKPIIIKKSPIIVDDKVYVSLTSLAEIFGITELKKDEDLKSISFKVHNKKVELKDKENTVKIDELNFEMDEQPIMHNNTFYVSTRFFSFLFEIENLQWNNKSNTVKIVKNNLTVADKFILKEEKKEPPKPEKEEDKTKKEEDEEKKEEDKEKKEPPEPEKKEDNSQNNDNLNEDDLNWLSKIVQAEAGGESHEGKLAVANVIINRKKSSLFPNTIKGVIFDKNNGVQFSPTINGAIYNTPSESSKKAAKEALSGINNIGNSLYFISVRIESSWVKENRTLYKVIEGNAFYL